MVRLTDSQNAGVPDRVGGRRKVAVYHETVASHSKPLSPPFKETSQQGRGTRRTRAPITQSIRPSSKSRRKHPAVPLHPCGNPSSMRLLVTGEPVLSAPIFSTSSRISRNLKLLSTSTPSPILGMKRISRGSRRIHDINLPGLI